MFQKNDHTPLEGVTLNDFWLVTNMMTFDNVGFSKAVSCSDLFSHDKKSKYLYLSIANNGPQ